MTWTDFYQRKFGPFLAALLSSPYFLWLLIELFMTAAWLLAKESTQSLWSNISNARRRRRVKLLCKMPNSAKRMKSTALVTLQKWRR